MGITVGIFRWGESPGEYETPLFLHESSKNVKKVVKKNLWVFWFVIIWNFLQFKMLVAPLLRGLVILQQLAILLLTSRFF